MKTVVIFFIRVYQIFFSRILSFITGSPVICRFSPTCSQYAIQVIQKYGIIKGSWLSVKRIASCQPWGKNYV